MIASLTLVVLFPAAHDCNVSTPLESGDETMAKVLLGLHGLSRTQRLIKD